MRSIFFEQNLTKIREEVLKENIIVFDTNALLDIYRYSNKNRNKFFEILSKVKNDLYLPHQVGEEFFNNRVNVIKNKIDEEKKIIDNFKKAFSAVENMLAYKDNKELLKKIQEKNNEIIKLIEKERGITSDHILKNDEVLDKILDIFDKKINEKLADEKLKEIREEGKKRFENKIPPGYKDTSKETAGKDPYGDLIIWKEIMDISKSKNKNILFVSNDTKDDWVDKYNGMVIGPK